MKYDIDDNNQRNLFAIELAVPSSSWKLVRFRWDQNVKRVRMMFRHDDIGLLHCALLMSDDNVFAVSLGIKPEMTIADLMERSNFMSLDIDEGNALSKAMGLTWTSPLDEHPVYTPKGE